MPTTVRAVAETSVPRVSRTNGYVEHAVQDNSAARMGYSPFIGALFLLGFLFYGVGAALVTSVTDALDTLATIAAHPTIMTAEIFGIHIGIVLSVPGIFFEVGLPVGLFSKGLQPEAYSGRVEGLTIIRPAMATS